MAQQNIDFGTFPDDPDADAIRTAFQKVQNNFSELYTVTSDSSVTSVNRSSGAGITVNSPTGNVVITAKIACVQVSTSTLSIGTDGNGGSSALITQGSQILVIDLPNNLSTSNLIANGNANIGGYAIVSGNLTGANLNTAGVVSATGNVTGGNLTTAGVVSATGNVSGGNLTTGGALSVTGNANVGNIGAVRGVFTGNISSLNANLGNAASANYFVGDGSLLTNVAPVAGPLISNGTSYVNVATSGGNIVSNVAGATVLVLSSSGANLTGYSNVTGNISAANASLGNSVTANYFLGNLYGAANTASTVTTNAQPNITSTGTLTILDVSGNITAANITANTGVFTGNGSGLSSIAGANVSGFVANANIANTAYAVAGANVSGAVTYATTANAVAGANVSGEVSFAATANAVAGANVSGTVSSATSATTAGTVTTNAQPNITSTGTLTSLAVTGNVTMANSVASTYTITGVTTGITAAGTVQANATALTKAMNVVSTVPSGTGVILPTAVAGMVVYITNTSSANSLLVYPASGAQINVLGTNNSFVHTSNATITFIAPTSTQWYTTGATYA